MPVNECYHCKATAGLVWIQGYGGVHICGFCKVLDDNACDICDRDNDGTFKKRECGYLRCPECDDSDSEEETESDSEDERVQCCYCERECLEEDINMNELACYDCLEEREATAEAESEEDDDPTCDACYVQTLVCAICDTALGEEGNNVGCMRNPKGEEVIWCGWCFGDYFEEKKKEGWTGVLKIAPSSD
jgi:hypothetical protein